MDNMDIITALSEQEGRYEYYSLRNGKSISPLLKSEHELVVNITTGFITLVDWEHRHFQAQCRFSTTLELPLIRQLFGDWPASTSYELLLPLLFSPELAARFMQGLTEAQASGQQALLALVLEPLRAVLERCQDRLRVFHLQIVHDATHGYRLIPLTQQQH